MLTRLNISRLADIVSSAMSSRRRILAMTSSTLQPDIGFIRAGFFVMSYRRTLGLATRPQCV